jgi:hypothetical protein
MDRIFKSFLKFIKNMSSTGGQTQKLIFRLKKDKTYESALSSLEQLSKDMMTKTQTNIMDINNFAELITDLVHFIQLRLTMMNM